MTATVRSLTNRDISEQYRGEVVLMMRKGFTGPFASWVVQQSPYEVPDITEALRGFNDYVTELLDGEIVKRFTYDELNVAITEEAFEKIPAVLALNVAKIGSGPVYVSRFTQPNPDCDFIDLGALARNVFYSIMRHHINWP